MSLDPMVTLIDDLQALIATWKHRARRKFQDAAGAGDPTDFSRRFIEHGATCYLNAALELENCLKQHGEIVQDADGVALHEPGS